MSFCRLPIKVPPISSSSFQINGKLYYCGGFKKISDWVYNQYLSKFYSVDSESHRIELSSSKCKRMAFSLSGITTLLIAVGGTHKKPLNISEKFIVNKNKWPSLPYLNSSP